MKIPKEIHNAAIWFVNNRINIIFLVVFATGLSMTVTAMVNSATCGDSIVTKLVIANIMLTALIGIFVALHQMGYPPKQEYVS